MVSNAVGCGFVILNVRVKIFSESNVMHGYDFHNPSNVVVKCWICVYACFLAYFSTCILDLSLKGLGASNFNW